MAHIITVIEAFVALLVCRLLLRGNGYRRLCRLVRRWPTAKRSPVRPISAVVLAVRHAQALLFHQTYCLEQSAVTCMLLRSAGHDARLVIGYRPQPLESHAWVEVNDEVVNDRPQYKKYFKVLEAL